MFEPPTDHEMMIFVAENTTDREQRAWVRPIVHFRVAESCFRAAHELEILMLSFIVFTYAEHEVRLTVLPSQR